MRLTKTALLAASFLSSAFLFGADQIITSPAGLSYTVNAPDTVYYNSNASGSINRLLGTGNFVKNGTGVLQYQGFQSFTDIYDILNTYYRSAGSAGTAPLGLVGNNALTGSVTVNAGELQVAGFLNYWYESNVGATPSGMQGVASVTLNDTAVLSFVNTPLDVTPGIAGFFLHVTGITPGRDLTPTLRYNAVNDLQVGGIAGGSQTSLNTGADSTYRILVNIDGTAAAAGKVYGVGTLAGRGDLIKTGSGNFTVLSSAQNGFGRVVLGAGSMTLADPSGNALATASSVNLVGSDGAIGLAVAVDFQSMAPPVADYWRPGFVPSTYGGAQLILNGNQTIQNLQADFAFTATPQTTANLDGTPRQATIADAIAMSAYNQFAGEAYTAGTGKGTSINIGGNTLNVVQTRDGIYGGSLIGNGTFNISIAANHTFALILESPTTANINHSGSGTFIANTNGLGIGNVTASGLVIYQDNAGTLNANLVGGGNVLLTASAFVNNSLSGTVAANKLQINVNDTRGTMAVGRVQSDFTGTLIVDDGQTLQLGAVGTTLGNGQLDDSLGNAAGVILAGGTGRVATLFVSGGKQTLNNLNTDSNSLVNIGNASLVLKGGSIAGAIAGTGNLLVDAGSSSLSINAASSTYVGATVVKSGSLNVSGSMTNSSGLILKSGATFNSGNSNQTFGALYGQSGSTVNMGSGTLIIGESAGTRLSLLQIQSTGGASILSTEYLGTKFQGTLPGGAVLAIGTNVDASSVGAAPAGNLAAFDTAQSGLAAATRLYLFNYGYDGASLAGAAYDAAVASASSLAFAGSITGTGGLVKTGNETLIFTGSGNIAYTGSTQVQSGVLQVDYASLSATSGVIVSSGAEFDINNSDTVVGGAFSRTITGAGLIGKVGAGFVQLSGDITGFTGGLSVKAGTLQVDSAGALVGAINIAAASTLVFNQTTDATTTGAVQNAGNLVKSGAGTLTLASYAGNVGSAVKVSQGTLALSSLPGGLEVDAGAILQATLTGGPNNYASQVTGTGTVRLVGSGAGATLTAQAANIFSTVTLDLRNTTFDLYSTAQTLGGFSGDAGSSLALNNGNVILNTAAGVNTVFNGQITGNGTLTKEGAGTASLLTTVPLVWLGQTTINAGTLEATPQALGSSDVIVNAGGTLALYNNDTTNAVAYMNPIFGAGVLAKTGAGEVSVGSISVTGGVHVEAGRLTTGDGGTDTVFNSVVISQGATFQVNMSGNRLHDSSSANSVTGSGSLAVSGGYTLTLAGVQSYTGNTVLMNGATLDLSANAITTLNGLDSGTRDSVGAHVAGSGVGTTVLTTGALTIIQSSAGTFDGQFTPATALTVQGTGVLSISGDLTARGLSTVTIAGGVLQVDPTNTTAITNNGTLNLYSAGSDRYTGDITGTGAVTKVGLGKLSFGDGSTTGVTGNPYVLGSTGTLTVAAGTLGGVFTTSGNLVVAAGGTLAPGNSPGTVTVNGNFTLAANGTLAVEVNASTSDKVVVTGTATIAGILKVTQDATPGSALPAGGQQFTIVTAAGGVTGTFSNASSTGIIQLDQTDPNQAATGYKRVHIENTGTALVLTGIAGLRDVSGFQQHDGIGGFVGVLDAGLAPAAVQAVTDNAWGAGTTAIVNNFSPLGFAAEYAMAQDGDNRRQAQLHDRMEQRRYDRGSPLTADDAPWEAFLVANSTYVDNAGKSSTSTFDYRSYGGLAGLDRKLNDGTVVGAAVGYDNGTADIHDGGGKIEMSRISGTAFFSGQLTSRWYFDVGVTGGVGLYDSKRDTALGRLSSKNDGYSGGAYAETGTLIVLAKDLHLTPYAGVSYTHHEFDGFTEAGNAAALKVDSWSQDSLRAQIGTGLNYFVPFETWKVRLSLDVNYSQELLDTDSDLDARFVAAGPKFSTTANALPDGAIGVTPSLGVEISERVSLSVGYTYEVGLDSRSYQSLNLALRTRF